MAHETPRLSLIVGAILLALAGCQPIQQAATTAQSAVQAQTTPTLSTTDATFINTAGALGLAEVELGELARTKASSPDVRRFAAQMVTDHTPANQQLAALARSKQMTPPSSMDTAHQQVYQQLQNTRGRAFDTLYMDGQVQDHQQAAQLFQTEAQNGTDPEVRAFAQQNLPKMQQHLAMAQRLAPKR
jgi:putative membrane protein